jgi:hypothetical protein
MIDCEMPERIAHVVIVATVPQHAPYGQTLTLIKAIIWLRLNTIFSDLRKKFGSEKMRRLFASQASPHPPWFFNF